uniref:Uncharacterized protein n=1 Tax=Tetranychus urticae TaxID=32264 RepID=T1KFI2_TETUR
MKVENKTMNFQRLLSPNPSHHQCPNSNPLFSMSTKSIDNVNYVNQSRGI